MDHWKLLRQYQGLVRLGQVQSFVCPDCDHEFVSMLGVEDEPVLWCPYDDNTFTPGTKFWSDVNNVVSKYNLE